MGNEIIFLSGSYNASVRVWNIKTFNYEITYIKTGIGSPVLTDVVLEMSRIAAG